MQCPVCPARDIPADRLTCENCGTDLSPIRRLLELANLHYNKALLQLQAGEHAQAISELHAAIIADPALSGARLLLGKVLWRAGQHTEAIAQWREAARTHPSDPIARELLSAAELSQSYGLPNARRWAIALTLSLGAVVVGILFALNSRHSAPESAELSASSTSVLPQKQAMEEPEPQPLSPSANQYALPSRAAGDSKQSGALSSLAERLRELDRLGVDFGGSAVRMLPQSGLFPPGSDIPTEAGHALLRNVRTVLDRTDAPMSVYVAGYTDVTRLRAGGRWKNNRELAISRGARVATLLGEGGSRHSFFLALAPDSVVRSAEAGETDDPARHRTAALEIRLAMNTR